MDAFNHRSGEHLEIDSARIYFEVQGRHSDPAVLLLHGGMGTLEDFNRIAPKFRQSHRLIAIDSRGHGKSTLGKVALTYERLQRDAEQIAAYFKLDSYSVIGFSDGGIAALRMAASPDSRIRKLVVIGTPCELKADDPKRDLYAGITADSWKKKFPATFDTYVELSPAPNFDALVAASVKMWLDGNDSGYPQDNVRKIRCDSMIVRGDDDHLVSRNELFDLVGRIKDAKMLSIPFAGHEVHKEQAEMLMQSVNQFLNR